MSPLKRRRLVQLGFGLLTFVVVSVQWFLVNTKEFVHYFPHTTPLNTLMWSYVLFAQPYYTQSITFLIQSTFLTCQFLTVPLKYLSFVNLCVFFHSQISEHTFSVIVLIESFFYYLALIVNYFVSSNLSCVTCSITCFSLAIRIRSSISFWAILRLN